MAKSALNNLQKDFLRESRFYLTGGAALVGFHLGHRETNDLDSFTLEDENENGLAIAREAARVLGASLEVIQTAPDFRRLLVRRGDETVIVDLVREYVLQLEPEKREIGDVRVDSPEEILANKLCALLSRSEIRDLVDVRELEQRGFNLENALRAAAQKDSGLTPGQLAWVLSQMQLGDDLTPPGDVSVTELRNYLDDLMARLKRLAFP